ncbi:Inner membrane protein YbhL [Paenibacillus larvae subsp. larvae]|uniref:Inner membrane protein YbhL n=1 Tax=Paenibacillus larvae subsp. larvae TaxID=147375 RepID=A0A2L1TXW4_9BACL|nr:Bax inhibitor-1/YccA family protein [Paenibacillus larvae]AQT86059.1 hypothetical protein B1222_19175 [Paenibacillus larvae subsp. pulvifaciens]AQZ45701.1 hypothetical protein B5S25_02880 [Paenibacillus larvae subsp. pulvifaciens]AVF25527.1 Inner membrane protein YbhL [Paenibacillus larvae subsp. larvae]AVF30304.1 Inner membrane protein YbhL [Paenibacillus larvae subsp. larvae]MBH0340820.1 membrane protein [Paenibacillus larvae]
MEQTMTYSDKGSFSHILRTFSLSLLVSFLGMLVGAYFIPPKMVPIFIFIELGMLIAALFLRKKTGLGYGFLYTFTAVSGVTLYPVIMMYGAKIGANVVAGTFITTAVIFGSLALYAHRSKRDFSFLGGFLFAATIGLIIISLINLFLPIAAGGFNILWAGAGVLIFSGWVLYDVSQYREGVAVEDVPMAALNIYLDFINLFLYLLRLVAAIFGGRD